MFSYELLSQGGSQCRRVLIDIGWNNPYIRRAGIALLAWRHASKPCTCERRNSLEMSALRYWHQECSSEPLPATQFSLGNQT